MPFRIETQQDEVFVELVRRPHSIANLELREKRFLFTKLRRWIVRSLNIGAQEAGKFDRLSARVEYAWRTIRRAAGYLHRGSQQSRVSHLRRDRAFPDELVHAQFVRFQDRFQLCWRAPELRRSDGFVCFLSVAHLGLVLTRPLMEVLAVHLANHTSGLRKRLLAQGGRVG